MRQVRAGPGRALERVARVKLICGLGNPGPNYDATRHNVGWWLADRLSADWNLGGFAREQDALIARGRLGDQPVIILKPYTYMNRSGVALAPILAQEPVDVERDLLVIVDDVALDVGRVRFRASGSAGGHNGLKSVASMLGTDEYARLRIGVGAPPAGWEMADWVLSPFDPADEDRVLSLMPELVDAVALWVAEGVESAMNRYNN